MTLLEHSSELGTSLQELSIYQPWAKQAATTCKKRSKKDLLTTDRAGDVTSLSRPRQQKSWNYTEVTIKWDCRVYDHRRKACTT